jgi:cysteinyl-tRNA synthetase
MEQAKTNYERIAEWQKNLLNISNHPLPIAMSGSNCHSKSLSSWRKKFESAMNDDLNTPLALSVLYELITETNKKITENNLSAEEAKQFLAAFEKMNKVFGLKFAEKEIEIPKEVKKLAAERLEARKNKDFQKADELRKKIEKMGYLIEDLNNKYKIKKK